MCTCCGGSLQTGTKIIAILEMVSSILILVFVFGALCFCAGAFVMATSGKDDHVRMSYKRSGLADFLVVGSIIGIVTIVVGILFIILSALLLSGANKRNRTRCMIWFVAHAIFFVLGWLGTFAVIFSRGGNTVFLFEGSLKRDLKVSAIAGSIIWNLIYAYVLWAVWAFMSEIKKKGIEVALQVPRIRRIGPQTWA